MVRVFELASHDGFKLRGLGFKGFRVEGFGFRALGFSLLVNFLNLIQSLPEPMSYRLHP